MRQAIQSEIRFVHSILNPAVSFRLAPVQAESWTILFMAYHPICNGTADKNSPGQETHCQDYR